MDCKERLVEYLTSEGAEFEIHHHDRPTYTAQAVAEEEHVSGKRVAKVVMVISDDQMSMFVLPAHLKVNLQAAASALGAAEARLAHENEFAGAFPDCDVGAMPPFGHLYGLKTFVDRRLAHEDVVFFQPGTHEDTMEMKYKDYERLANATTGDFAD